MDREQDDRALRETLRIWALARLPSASVEQLLELTFFLPAEEYVTLFASLPQKVALAFATMKLGTPKWSRGAMTLSTVFVTHFDAELFARYLEVTQGGWRPMAALGPQALPALVAFIEKYRTPKWEQLIADGAVETPCFAVMEIVSRSTGPIEQQAIEALGLPLLQFGEHGRGTPETFDVAMLMRLPEPLRVAMLRNALHVLVEPSFAFRLVGTVKSAAFHLEATKLMLAKRQTIATYDGFEEGVRAVGPEVLAQALQGMPPPRHHSSPASSTRCTNRSSSASWSS